MKQTSILKKGIIRKSGDFRYNLKREKVEDGSYVVIARPLIVGFFDVFIMIILPSMIIWMLSFFVASLFWDSLPISSDWSTWLFERCGWPPAILCFLWATYSYAKQIIPEKRYGGLKFVFYPAHAGFAKGANESGPRYEVYYLGEIREHGIVTEEKLCHATDYSREAGSQSISYIGCRTRLLLESQIDGESLDPNDPFRKHAWNMNYEIFSEGVHRYAQDTDNAVYESIRSRAQELRRYLDLPLEGSTDYVDWDQEALRLYKYRKSAWEIHPPHRPENATKKK